MPSVAQSLHWFVRIDGTQEFLMQKVQILSLQVSRLLCVFHTGKKAENPHCHFVLSMAKELQKQSLDVKLKKIFGVSGNGYSSKVWDGELVVEGAGTYLFHESIESPVLCSKGVSAEEIEKIKSTAQLVNKVIEANRQKAETKIPGKVLEVWNEKGNPEWGNREIVYCICRMAKVGDCYLPKGDFQWKAYVEEVKMKMSDTPQKFEVFMDETYRRIYF